MMKKSIGKRFIDTLAAALIVAAFCVAFISIAGCKAYAASPCTYLDYDSDGKATTKTITEYTEITSNTHKLTNGWYVVSSYVTLGSRLEVTGNNVRVIIKDGATLNAPMGIHHAGDDVLFIYGQKNGTGKLIARGTTGCAGIGGNSKERGGTLNVHGVRVEAYGGQNAAGIGGGSGGAAGAFYSYAGSTYAEGGAGSDNGLIGGGAGIGGGYAGGGGYHQIYGGDVEAHGGRYAAGIGAGQWGKEGQLYIKNADVKAYGGFDAAGIGTGYNGGEGFYMFSMSGGTLYAEGQGGAAGIGGGPGSAGIRDTNISGGKITAVAGSTGTVAFGHGNEIFGNLNTGDGSMELQADMMVKAGSSASNAKVVKTNKTADKVSACHSNKYAEITKCSHPSKSYTNIGNDTSHQWDCTICGRIGTENHRQGSGNKCVCGADLSGIWVIKDGFYLIYNENHWNKMCDMVDNNQCGQRKFKLMNDISVSRPAGRNAKIQQQNTSFELTKHCFNGTFDGGGHTLEFNYTGTTPSGYVAPFVVARNATIMNLHVTGTIHNTGTGDGGVGGLIGLSSMYGSTITNVRISSTLRYDGKGSHVGGFIAGHFAENSGWVDEYKGCVFDGKIYSESSIMAGFHAKDVKAQMTDCLFIPSKLGNHSDNSRTFSIGGAKSLTNCFYTTRIGNFQESGSKQVYSVKSATPGISISYVGSPTVKYNAGLYTRYGSIIDYNGTCYASQGTSVTLKLTFSKPEYADHLRLNGSAAGIRNNGNGTYTFTMPAKDTVIDVEPPLEVRFLNDDGSVFHSAEVFAGGSLSANDYPSSDPVKASDGDNVKYTFAGWEYKGGDIPDVIRESIDITPVFTASYRVNFIRDDGSLIDRAFYPEGTRVSEIEFPADPTKDPTKDAEGHYSYVFDHWDKSTEVVTAETNYTAHFNTNMSEHNWTFSLDWSSDYNWLTAKATCCVDTKHPHSESERVEGHREAVWDDGANPCVDRGKWKYYVTYDDFSAGGVFYNSILYPEFYTAQYSFKYNVDPLGHDWIVEDGTDEDGWSVWATDEIIHEERRCRRCGTVEEREYTSDHIHGQSLLGFSMEIPPTCTMNGKYEYVVCSCGAPIREEDGRWIEISDKDLIIPATGHSQKAAVKEKEKQPTCTSPGSYEDVVYCKVCDEALSSEYVTTEPLGHDWGEPKYDRDWENGKVSAKRTCSRDADHIETETVQAIEHIDKEPTCEEKGSKYYDAEFTNEAFEMQKSEDVELDELGHDWDDGEITQESSCTEEGIRTFTCSRCDEKKTSKIPKSDHETFAVTDETSNTATCTEAGTMKQHEICALCGETITTTEIDTEPLGHLFWDLTYEWADDMSTVTAKHVCARDGCNETESETVKPTSIVLKKNSCETEGLIRYHAEFRNEAFEPQEIETKTEVLGHDWGEWKETKAPTCSAAGEKERVCNNDSSHKETASVAIDPDAHDWGEWVVTKEATEMTDGEETRTCRNDSSHTETQAIPALEHKHDLSKVDAVAATCTKEGNIEYWICDKGANACNRCFADKNGKKEIDKEDTVIKATGHTPGVTVKENEVSATCKEDGSYDEVIYCTICKEELSRETTHTAPLGHDWEDFAETVDGIHIHIKRVCRRDASHVIEYDEDEGGHAHDFSRVEKKDATCESSGIMAHVICQICGNRYTDMDAETELSERNVYIEPLGHDWGEWKETKAPTCSAAGEKQRVCKNDASHKDIGTLAIVPDAHEWGEWTQTKAPTCSAAGEKQRVCKNDSNHEETETLAIDPDAHDWGEWTVIREATETRKGEKIRICKNNTRSHIEMREIPVLGHEHKLTKVDAADATCTEDGNIEYWICDQGANACGGYFADKNGKKEINKEDTVIKATGHKPGSAVKENEVTATCEKDGSYDEVVYCTICKEELSRETKMVTALGHDWGEWVVTKEATETEEGEETRTCKNDPSHTETRVIPMGLSYRNVSGDGNVWYKGSNETSDFAFKRSVDDASTITHFTGISVDGSDVDPSCYTKESGSVIIKLEPEYLETLELGKHTLTSRFDDWDGNASAEFTVAEQEAQGDDNGDAGTDGDDQSTNGARTGDETMVVLWEMFFGGSLLLLLILAMRRRMLRR